MSARKTAARVARTAVNDSGMRRLNPRQRTSEHRPSPYPAMPLVVLADPHGVPCPTCGARPLQPCRWREQPTGDLVVHGRRTSAWLRDVAPVLTEREWLPFPAVETVAALEARRAAMRARHCVARRVTAYLLARHGLRSAVLDCVPCSGEAAPAIGGAA